MRLTGLKQIKIMKNIKPGQMISDAMCELDELISKFEETDPRIGITEDGLKAAVNLFMAAVSERSAFLSFSKGHTEAEYFERSDSLCFEVVDLVKRYTGVNLNA